MTKFELAYYNVATEHFIHNSKDTAVVSDI